LKYLFSCILSILLLCSAHGVDIDKDYQIYKKGIRQYKIGSYSVALDYFLKLLKPDSKYYANALLMLSKTYYAIGRKTGNKKFFWQALNYLQLYFINLGNKALPWDYYYTKAKIYEALSFYEQALAVYRVAFLKAKTQKERIDTTIGIIRTALWSQRIDIVDEYFILVSTSPNLNSIQKREILFLKGLILFLKGNYEKALPYFFRLYKEFEEYLIDNPEYYFIVAENIYRTGKLNLSEQVFRRIASLVKDPLVVRKSYIRLGDIELKKNNYKLAFIYYYSVIRDFPTSEEAEVARLKIIPLMDIPVVKYRALLSKDPAFENPISYITKVLVNYRTTYVGIYALSDFGYLVFKLGAPKNIFDRLTWEVSLIFPEQVKFEQKEFLKRLWEPYLLKLPSEKMCLLYRSNPRFFQFTFDKNILIKIEKDLKSCNQRKLRIELLKFILNKWKKDSDRLLLAEALFEDKDFQEAIEILKEVKNKKLCLYIILKDKIEIILGNNLNIDTKGLRFCEKKFPTDVNSILIYHNSVKNNFNNVYKILRLNKSILDEYQNDIITKMSILKFLELSLQNDNYLAVFSVSKSLIKKGYKDCLIGSFYTISSTRLGKLDDARKGYALIKGCVDNMAVVSRTAYEDLLLEENNGNL
jgi:tetratricopeptide (TPR) repeat protein